MGKPRHDSGGMGCCEVNCALLQAGEFTGDAINSRAQIKTDVSGNLIVTGSAGVQLFAGHANQCGQAGFDVHVHVF